MLDGTITNILQSSITPANIAAATTIVYDREVETLTSLDAEALRSPSSKHLLICVRQPYTL